MLEFRNSVLLLFIYTILIHFCPLAFSADFNWNEYLSSINNNRPNFHSLLDQLNIEPSHEEINVYPISEEKYSPQYLKYKNEMQRVFSLPADPSSYILIHPFSRLESPAEVNFLILHNIEIAELVVSKTNDRVLIGLMKKDHLSPSDWDSIVSIMRAENTSVGAYYLIGEIISKRNNKNWSETFWVELENRIQFLNIPYLNNIVSAIKFQEQLPHSFYVKLSSFFNLDTSEKMLFTSLHILSARYNLPQNAIQYIEYLLQKIHLENLYETDLYHSLNNLLLSKPSINSPKINKFLLLNIEHYFAKRKGNPALKPDFIEVNSLFYSIETRFEFSKTLENDFNFILAKQLNSGTPLDYIDRFLELMQYNHFIFSEALSEALFNRIDSLFNNSYQFFKKVNQSTFNSDSTFYIKNLFSCKSMSCLKLLISRLLKSEWSKEEFYNSEKIYILHDTIVKNPDILIDSEVRLSLQKWLDIHENFNPPFYVKQISEYKTKLNIELESYQLRISTQRNIFFKKLGIKKSCPQIFEQ